ncbi:MAG: apolipoprotein N-acyltransferase [Alphaproteobacteria bacterium]|nr:apolipoprotein N-acyltransferase [Alphaproteobacteria bacterium]
MPETVISRIRPGSRLDTPLCRLALDVAALTGRRRYGLAFLLGAAAAAAMSPVDMVPLLAVAFPGLLWLDDGSTSAGATFRLGWVFGFGFFLAGLYWIAAALFVDLARFWWLVPFAAAGLPAGFAIYIAFALLTTRLVVQRLQLSAAARVFVFAIAWSAAEWTRGHAFTGLPWNLVGYTWSGGFPGAIAMLQSVAVVGIYGLSFITVLAFSLLSLLGSPRTAPMHPLRRWAPGITAILLVTAPALGGAVRLASTPIDLTGTRLRLVQPSITESLKWQPAAAQDNFRRLIDLSRAPTTERLNAILWPEAATPFLLGRDRPARDAIAAVVPKGGYVIAGALRTDPPPAPIANFWNSIEAVNAHGDIVAHYDKAHLVPFGEYVPFRKLLPIDKITPGTTYLSPGPGPQTIALPGLPPFAPLVCYEAIFPGSIIDEDDRPAWILNVTNDAWYGRSSGPYQHFAIARTRAVEEDLPLIRVANNGISGVIDPVGRVLAHTGLDAIGYVDSALPTAGSRTPYARVGNWMLLGLLLLGAVPVALRLG